MWRSSRKRGRTRDAKAQRFRGGALWRCGGVTGWPAGSASVVVSQAPRLATAGRVALSPLTALGRLGRRRPAALYGQEVGALERPTSGEEELQPAARPRGGCSEAAPVTVSVTEAFMKAHWPADIEPSHLGSGGLRRSAQPGGPWQLEGWFLSFYVSSLGLSVGEAGGAPVWLIARRSSSAKPSRPGFCGREAPLGLRAVGRLGCPRHAALIGQEVGALERPTSGHEAHSSAANAGNSPNSTPPGEAALLNDVFRRFRARACV
jgi:hypothetical protein